MKKLLLGIAVSASFIFSPAMAGKYTAVLNNYADIAEAGYKDSMETAIEMRSALRNLVNNPSEDTLADAKKAWLDARVPYQQTEAFRFGNPVVDDWEGKVNAWPLDEGLIDYVSKDYGTESESNPYYSANIIANKSVKIAGEKIDASSIDIELLEKLHEIGEVEANVATGYHAIEFLLWGQDLNGTKAGAGKRPYTDFAKGSACTGGNCDRRGDYLLAAADLLISDLADIITAWEEGGEGRKNLLDDEKAGITAILTGMGSLSYGELAGERTKLGLMLHDPEEEHDCFSDNTHNSHFYNAKGIQNVYMGQYGRVGGSSLYDLVASKNKKVADKLKADIEASVSAGREMVTAANNGQSFDQLIAEGNKKGNKKVQNFVDALVHQTKSIEKAVKVLGLSKIEFEGSDSLDNPSAVE